MFGRVVEVGRHSGGGWHYGPTWKVMKEVDWQIEIDLKSSLVVGRAVL